MRTYRLNPHKKFVTFAALLLMAGGVQALAAEVDARILSTARYSLLLRPPSRGQAIKVKCSHGRVTLTGQVADLDHKARAERSVAGLPGVRSVDNRLTILNV